MLAPMSSLPSHPAATSLLDRGIYDIVEVAQLLRRGRQRVEGWVRGGLHDEPPLYVAEFGDRFSFLDLVSLHVISELLDRGVSVGELRHGAEYLRERLGTDRPFAHKSLATVGSGFFAEVGEWIDVGRGGQGAFKSVIVPLLQPIEYGTDGLARIWRPHEMVWINPEVQAGTPCIEGTRVPTRTVFDLVTADADIDEIADDFTLDEPQIRAAVEFERLLAA